MAHIICKCGNSLHDNTDGDETYTIIALYRAVGMSGTLHINDDESHRQQYFPLDALPELKSRAEYVIKRLKENHKL